jgi:hypothetical protein
MEAPNSLPASQSPNDEPKTHIPAAIGGCPFPVGPYSRTSQTHYGHRNFQGPFLPSTSPTLRISWTSHLAFMTHDSDLSCCTPADRLQGGLATTPSSIVVYPIVGPKHNKQGSFYCHLISNPFQSSSANNLQRVKWKKDMARTTTSSYTVYVPASHHSLP